jgi:hypothetical protein
MRIKRPQRFNQKPWNDAIIAPFRTPRPRSNPNFPTGTSHPAASARGRSPRACACPNSPPSTGTNFTDEQWYQLKVAVYRGYETPYEKGYDEVDHLVSIELMGTNDIDNLWTEPTYATWNAYVKTHLENRLHELVCDGQISLETAQSEIVTDWIAAYKKFIAPEPQGETAEYEPETFNR